MCAGTYRAGPGARREVQWWPPPWPWPWPWPCFLSKQPLVRIAGSWSSSEYGESSWVSVPNSPLRWPGEVSSKLKLASRCSGCLPRDSRGQEALAAAVRLQHRDELTAERRAGGIRLAEHEGALRAAVAVLRADDRCRLDLELAREAGIRAGLGALEVGLDPHMLGVALALLGLSDLRSTSNLPMTAVVSDLPDPAIATPVVIEPAAIATASHLRPRIHSPLRGRRIAPTRARRRRTWPFTVAPWISLACVAPYARRGDRSLSPSGIHPQACPVHLS